MHNRWYVRGLEISLLNSVVLITNFYVTGLLGNLQIDHPNLWHNILVVIAIICWYLLSHRWKSSDVKRLGMAIIGVLPLIGLSIYFLLNATITTDTNERFAALLYGILYLFYAVVSSVVVFFSNSIDANWKN